MGGRTRARYRALCKLFLALAIVWTWTWRARRAGARIYSRRVECKINEGREAKEGRAIAHTVREYYELATVRGTVSVSVPPAQLLNSWIVDGGRNVFTRRVAEKRRRNVRRDGGRRGRLRDAKEGRKPKEIKGRARGQASEARAPTEGRGTNAMKFEFPPSGRKRMMGGKATDGGAREESLPSEDRHKGGKEDQKRDDARPPPRHFPANTYILMTAAELQRVTRDVRPLQRRLGPGHSEGWSWCRAQKRKGEGRDRERAETPRPPRA
ncbi:hypothetical protein FB451DRAFT_1172876 [Mycena latifolia]|nr:hypothetical protein FB451DRAFT_1172876 [Mycena latifolia]